MKIFISWSGVLSNKVAIYLREFLKQVIQATNPYMTAMDAPKGAVWLNEIADNLNESKFGIVCLTKENLKSPWLLFETGALSKQFGKDKARVWTILIDNLSDEEIQEPLSIFQHTRIDEDDMLQLFSNINKELGDQKLEETLLIESFKTWWPKFVKKYEDALEKAPEIKTLKKTLSKQETAMYELMKLSTYLSEEITDIKSNVSQIKNILAPRPGRGILEAMGNSDSNASPGLDRLGKRMMMDKLGIKVRENLFDQSKNTTTTSRGAMRGSEDSTQDQDKKS